MIDCGARSRNSLHCLQNIFIILFGKIGFKSSYSLDYKHSRLFSLTAEEYKAAEVAGYNIMSTTQRVNEQFLFTQTFIYNRTS